VAALEVPSLGKVARFAVPALGVYLASPTMSLVDTAFVGLGDSGGLELAALSPGTALCDTLVLFFNFLWVATTGLVASASGDAREKTARVRTAMHGAMYAASLLGVALAIFLATQSPAAMAFMGVDPAVIAPAAHYIAIRGAAMPFQLVGMACNAGMLGAGDSKASLLITLAAAAVNLVGDWLLCPKTGIVGAAWATAASLVVYCALQILAAWRKGMLPRSAACLSGGEGRQGGQAGSPLSLLRPPSRGTVAAFMGYCGPYSFAMSTRVIGILAVASAAARLGATPLGAHQVLGSLFFFLACWGEPLGQTAQSMIPPLVRRGAGAGLSPKSSAAVRSLIGLLARVCIGVSVLLGLAGSALLGGFPGFFTSSAEVAGELLRLSPMMAVVLVFSCINVLIDGILLSLRDMRALIAITSCTFSVQMACLLLGLPDMLGLVGVWCAQLGRLLAFFVLGIPRILHLLPHA